MQTLEERRAAQVAEWASKLQELARAVVTVPLTPADEAEALLVAGTWLHAGPYRPVLDSDGAVTFWLSDYGDVVPAHHAHARRVTTTDAWQAYAAHLKAKPAPVCNASAELIRAVTEEPGEYEYASGAYFCGACEEMVPLVEDSGDMHIAPHDTDGKPVD